MVTAVMIGIDPHKGSHTAVAISRAEEQLGRLRVGAGADQAGRLIEWAAGWPDRTWAVENATGLGHLLAQQLVAAGERVLDIQPKLAARVRVLEAGNTHKNDPNDALSVAVAALRSKASRAVAADDHAAVLRMRGRRHRDLDQARNQVACRLHAVLAELVPGGLASEITTAKAEAIIERAPAGDPVAATRLDLAAELLADLRHLDDQIRESKKKLATAVRASGTSVTGLFGTGPVVAAIVIGDAADVRRFATRDRFAAWNGTAPVEVSSGGEDNPPAVAAREPAGQLRHPRRRGHPDPVPAQPRPGLLRQEDRRGQDPQGGAALPQAADQRRDLRLPARRRHQSRSGRRPGRATGERL